MEVVVGGGWCGCEERGEKRRSLRRKRGEGERGKILQSPAACYPGNVGEGRKSHQFVQRPLVLHI